MRELQKEDINKWNARLSKINLAISATIVGGHHNLKVFITPEHKNYYDFNLIHNEIKSSPIVNYDFSFSISEKSIKRFDSLLDSFLEDGMQFYIYQFGKFQNPIRFEKTHFDKYLTIKNHNLYEVNYEQRNYKFRQEDLFNIIYFITCVEDVVKIISEYYEYESDGKEICKIKYPVGTIVSIVSDKSGDYMVQNVKFIRSNSDTTLGYHLTKIETPIKSEVLIFSNDILYCLEEDIVSNRDNRLNILLN